MKIINMLNFRAHIIKKIITLFIICFAALFGFSTTSSDPEMIVTGLVKYENRIIEDFEESGEWSARCINNKKDITCTARIITVNSENSYYKDVDFGKKVLEVVLEIRDLDEFEVVITPPEPIKIGKGLNTISAYVNSNNYRHLLTYIFMDEKRREIELVADRLNFIGFKELKVAALTGMNCKNLKFKEFKICLNPLELQGGKLYYYFDLLEVTTATSEGASK